MEVAMKAFAIMTMGLLPFSISPALAAQCAQQLSQAAQIECLSRQVDALELQVARLAAAQRQSIQAADELTGRKVENALKDIREKLRLMDEPRLHY
jgi:erythromycin esterase-like protein